jgi:N-acetylneuraminic acid mutarotase
MTETAIYTSKTTTATLTVTSPQWIKRGGDIDGEAASDYSGQSVSLSADGTIVAIGAPFNDGVNGTDSGHVRVYKYDTNTNTWDKLGGDIDGEAANDQSGRSVSLSADGTIVAIGANVNNAGHVRVYKYDATKTTAQWSNQSLANYGPAGWNRLGADIDGEAFNDQSGYSVSLSADGTIVAIGAYANDGNGNNSGHVRVYKYNTNNNTWNKLGGDIDGEAAGDNSGQSVSLSADGTIVAIGENYNDGVNGTDSGHVRVYKYDTNTNTWNQRGGDIDGEAPYNRCGQSVSISADGTIVAIGANYNTGVNGSYSGHVRVYKYDATKTTAQWSNQSLANYGPVGWNRLGGDIDGEATFDQIGTSVSLSADGTIVAIGAPFNDGNGLNSGQVRVYKYDTVSNTWVQSGGDIDGEAFFDSSGTSVSLSSDGKIVAIGADFNDGNGSNSGHVRVYRYQ